MAFDAYNGGSGNWLASDSTLAHGIGTGRFSVAGWFYPTAISASLRAGYANGGLGASFALLITEGVASKFAVWMAGTYAFNTVLTANQWVHLCVTRDNTGLVTGYVNGVAEATTHPALLISLATNTQYISGADSGSYASRANSGEVALWSGITLSASEVAALAKRVKPPDVRTNGLKLYCPLVRERRDRWSYGSNFTAQNGAAAYVTHPRIIEQMWRNTPDLTAGGGGGGGGAQNRYGLLMGVH